MAKPTPARTRPMPPDILGAFNGDYPVNVMPALDMPLWVKSTFLDPKSKVFNNDHYHPDDFMDGQICFIWAAGGYTRAMRRIIGITEELVFRCSYWQKMRQQQQMMEWFGHNLPAYIITLDADYCRQCSDVEFFALVEHELYHIGHKHDEFGPAFSKKTGLPKLAIRGHDVEEFIEVVRRYGASAEVQKMVDAANQKPTVSRVDIAGACGTCLRLAA